MLERGIGHLRGNEVRCLKVNEKKGSVRLLRCTERTRAQDFGRLMNRSTIRLGTRLGNRAMMVLLL